MGQSHGRVSCQSEDEHSPKANKFDRQHSPAGGFCSDGHGSGQSDGELLAKALTTTSNPAVACARYHVETSRKLTDDYRVNGTVLGKGMNGEVVLARSKSDGREYALKRFHKQQLSEDELGHLCQEVQICLSIDHPGIARLHDVYDTKSQMCLVMECCRGGELFGRLEDRGQYAERDAADAALQMFRAVNYLHKHHVVHRDIKLENFLYESKADDAALKLIDFGFAKVWDRDTLMMARCGSIAYVSPDVLTGDGYTSQCDVWSLGVVVFMLLSGYPPFHGTDAQIRAKIKGGKPNFNQTSCWQDVSEEAQDFVRALLDKDPCRRPTAQDALQHPWLTMNTNHVCPQPKLSYDVVVSLGKYMCSSKIKRTTLQLLAQELLPDETSELRDMFLQMDTDKTGTISLSQLKEAIRGFREGSSTPRTPHSGMLSLGAASSVCTSQTSRDAQQAVAELFDVLDANGDEQVYYSDFLAAASKTRSHLRPEAVRKVFNRLDTDRTGILSASDLYRVVGKNFADVSAHDLLCDFEVTLDGQGSVTFDTFFRMLECHDAVPVLQPLSATCAGAHMMDSLHVVENQPLLAF